MKHSAIRLWFGLAVAVIAAAIADPIVETVSNAGWFGPGSFTDHSNLDVLPALLAGAVLVGCYLVLRVRRALLRASGEALRANVARLLPFIFLAQMGVLFAMETTEQLVVSGHTMGGTIWLGGPIWFSLTVHAAMSILVAYALARTACACAHTTLRAVRHLHALAIRALHGQAPIALRRRERTAFARLAPVRCRIGNRAPPFAFA
ncbi:MAG TPA: hypothetical protein VMF11_10795 [Candidatus Baltobacteraceae bacterium]|nr:hypothetical protein [Candidatus Baltobacteraceae bacterium]